VAFGGFSARNLRNHDWDLTEHTVSHLATSARNGGCLAAGIAV